MNRTLAMVILIISLMGCVVALDEKSKVEMRPGEVAFEQLFNIGIGEPWIGGNPPWAHGQSQDAPGVSTTQFSQFYRMTTGPVPSTHVTAPQEFDINGNAPVNLFFGTQNQAIPYSQYQTMAIYAGSYNLWIDGSTSWTQYVQVPQGASLSLISTSPNGGKGYLFEIGPDDKLIRTSYKFYRYNRMGFYASALGQHILLYAIGNQVSNAVVIDVVENRQPYQLPYQLPYQPPGHPPLTY
jgi:hypothetical protein